MKFTGLLLISLLVLFCTLPIESVKSQTPVAQASVQIVEAAAPVESQVYFKANGVDPVWTLRISPDQVIFTAQASGFETFIAPHTEPIKAMDSNIKMYQLQTEAGQMEIELAQMLCQNENSRERFSYAVTVSFKQGKDTSATYFTGCGLYVTEANLEAIWILDQLNMEKVIAAQFNDTLPYIELHANGNSFKGYGGCNTLNGRIFSERRLLRFTDMVLSKRSCATIAKEKEFIKALQFSTQFEIDADRLVLSNPGGLTLVFKKAD